jgi:hypothetical protein
MEGMFALDLEHVERPIADPVPAEDSLNIALREITVTARDGRVSQLEQVYIRGSMVSLGVADRHRSMLTPRSDS